MKSYQFIQFEQQLTIIGRNYSLLPSLHWALTKKLVTIVWNLIPHSMKYILSTDYINETL